MELGLSSHMLTLVVDEHFDFLYFKILTFAPKCIIYLDDLFGLDFLYGRIGSVLI